MTDTRIDIKRRVRRSGRAAKQAIGDVTDAVKSAAEQTREAARVLFEKIKAARVEAATQAR